MIQLHQFSRRAAVALLSLLWPVPYANAQDDVAAGPQTIDEISAYPLSKQADGERVVGWTFESVGYARDVGRKRIVRVGPEGDASATVPEDGEGVVLSGTSATARGDLISPSFRLKPFRWVELEVAYQRESGQPVAFVGLRPTSDRSHVDLEFFKVLKSKRSRTAKVRVHSGASKGPYSVALSVAGEGAVRILSVKAVECEPYKRPEKPLCVIDIRTTKPTRKPNPNFARVASVFGFPSVEYLHYTEFDADKLAAIDPAVIVLPGLISLKGANHDAIDSAVRDAVRFDAPVVGVCLGHQVLARAHGAKLRRGQQEWGPTRIDVVARDPLFEGLPRGRSFHASESHRFEVVRPVGKMQLIASSDACANQVFRYRGKRWYTFQGHIERGWEVASPEACLLWKNMLREWGVIDQ